MELRRQDIAVLLLYYLGFSRVRNLLYRFKGIPKCRFITFHNLKAIDWGKFEMKMQFLKEKTNVISMDDFFEGKGVSEKINVVITFDDGYKSWILSAVPTLERFQLPATFFLSSGFLDLPKKEEEKFKKDQLLIPAENNDSDIMGLASNEVKKLAEGLFTLGGHTLNHVNLSKLQNEREVDFEIERDKDNLEKICGKNIEYFSYPLGEYRNDTVDLAERLQAAGYKAAVTTEPGFNNNWASPGYFLKRDLTGASIALNVFKARVYGNYDGVLTVKNWLRKITGYWLRLRAAQVRHTPGSQERCK